MSLLVIFALVLVVYTARAIYQNLVSPWKNAPPGPPFVPGIGSGLSFKFDWHQGFESPSQMIHRLSKKYGPVMRMKMGSDDYIFLSGLEEIKSYAVLESTTARPYNQTLLDMYSDGKPLGFGIGVGGERWKEQRKFALKVLNELSEKKTGMEERILNEVRFTIEDMKEKTSGGEKILTRVDKYFYLPALNVIWELVAATRHNFDDESVHTQFDYLRSFLHEKMAGPMTAIQWLKNVPPFSGIYSHIRTSMNQFRTILSEVIQQQKSTFDADLPRGYIDRFLVAQKDQKGRYFTDEDLLINCQDLFIAGTETAASTVSYAILHMILRPDIQARVQQEIDEHVGKDREVTLDDRQRLVLTEATLMEVRRHTTPFPIMPPRTSNQDLTIRGYRIPAGSIVQMNLYSVLRGKAYWQDPDEFVPERFINDRNQIVTPEAFIPFGYGKRRCLGEKLANMSNFLFFANLLQTFSFRCEDLTKKPTLASIGGLTFGPAAFNVKITLRD